MNVTFQECARVALLAVSPCLFTTCDTWSIWLWMLTKFISYNEYYSTCCIYKNNVQDTSDSNGIILFRIHLYLIDKIDGLDLNIIYRTYFYMQYLTSTLELLLHGHTCNIRIISFHLHSYIYNVKSVELMSNNRLTFNSCSDTWP